jgi:hypothetical protein
VIFDPPPCDRCAQEAIVQIIIIAFEGPSPSDQFLCKAHPPSMPTVPENGGPTVGGAGCDSSDLLGLSPSFPPR